MSKLTLPYIDRSRYAAELPMPDEGLDPWLRKIGYFNRPPKPKRIIRRCECGAILQPRNLTGRCGLCRNRDNQRAYVLRHRTSCKR